jgi:hypothetical protein
MLAKLMCIGEIKDGIQRRRLGTISWNKIPWFAMDPKAASESNVPEQCQTPSNLQIAFDGGSFVFPVPRRF